MNENISNIDYKQVIEYALDPLIIHSQLSIIYVNHAAELFFRASKEQIIGTNPLDIFKETSKSAIDKRIKSAYEKPAKVIEETIFRTDGTAVDVELYCHPVMIGDTKAIQTYVHNITNRKQDEYKQKQFIRELNELSATLVPLLKGIGVLPLIGSIDEEKAKILLERVPINAQKLDLESVIIDFSSIYNLDLLVSEYIFKIINVLSLQGIRSIVTGMRPHTALVALDLGMDLKSIKTVSTVKEALHILGVVDK